MRLARVGSGAIPEVSPQMMGSQGLPMGVLRLLYGDDAPSSAAREPFLYRRKCLHFGGRPQQRSVIDRLFRCA